MAVTSVGRKREGRAARIDKKGVNTFPEVWIIVTDDDTDTAAAYSSGHGPWVCRTAGTTFTPRCPG